MSLLQTLKQRVAAVPLPFRRGLLSVLGFGLAIAAVGTLVYLVYRERTTLLPQLLALNPTRLVPVLLLYVADLCVFALAWASVAGSFGVRASLARHLRIFVAANAARRLPGTLWYVGGRGALYGRAGIAAGPVLMGSGAELGLLWVSALAVATPGAIALLPQRQWLYSGAALALLIALVNPWTLGWAIRRATRSETLPAVPLRRAYGWLVLYMVAWLLGGLVLFAVISAFQPLALSNAPSVVAAWTISATLSMLTFFLPSGFGVMELGLTALLASIVSPGLAVLAALAVRVLVTALDVLLGLPAYALEAAARP